MKNKTQNHGFTLIELLVVVAIIGLLASVILASLGGARRKGARAAVLNQLDSIRAAFELKAASSPYTYPVGCTAFAEIQEMLTSLGDKTGKSPVCLSSSDEWCVSVELGTGTFLRADSTGYIGEGLPCS